MKNVILMTILLILISVIYGVWRTKLFINKKFEQSSQVEKRTEEQVDSIANSIAR